jgi:hypothetical protein
MTELQTTVYTLPAHWASVLINNDYTGVSDEDEQEIDNFIDGEFGESLFCTVCITNEDEPSFCKYHDAQPYGVLACDCLDYTFIH